MALTDASDPRVDARRRRTVAWVVGLATLGMIFDGYDLVVYGAAVPPFLRDPSQIGHVSPAMAGALGSSAGGEPVHCGHVGGWFPGEDGLAVVHGAEHVRLALNSFLVS
jgi:hypothetical protein